MMSPQIALCEVGSRESSAGGFRRAGLALRKLAPGAPGGRGEARGVRRHADLGPARARLGPPPPGVGLAAPGPSRARLRLPSHPGWPRSRPGPRDRRVTREHVT